MLLKENRKFGLQNYEYVSFYLFRPTSNNGYYPYADNAVMSIFCIQK